MKVISGRLNTMPALDEPLAMTIGNFDGVHRGHRALIERLKKEASARGLKTAVLSFCPHPSEFFKVSNFEYLQTEKQRQIPMQHSSVQSLVFVSRFAKLHVCV